MRRHPREAPGLALALLVVVVTVGAAWMISWAAGIVVVSLLVLTAAISRLRATQHLARAAEITPTQFAQLYPMVASVRERFAMPRTRVFVTQSPEINAVAYGFSEPYVIVLTSALLDALDQEELTSVVGHEMGHIKFGHTRLGVLLGGVDARGLALPFPLNGVAALRDLVFLWWQRSTEMTADRAGIIACGRPSKAISAQVKLSVGPTLHQHVNLNDLAQQAADLRSGVARVEGFVSQLGASHPFLIHRIEAMLDFVSRSEPTQPESSLQPAMARLVAPGHWEHVLVADVVVVGRSSTADLRLHDRAASRRHFELRWIDGGYVLTDLGSSNGTFVNGQRVQSATLHDGDVIRVGTTELEFAV
ncbi:MAG TPA: M48 family metalloprotease [Chloroflexota bacterium]|jgi:Zn-dependent protease with chaperone function|nr:M48 family metalloprotease [Chloroflexota bacterium]